VLRLCTGSHGFCSKARSVVVRETDCLLDNAHTFNSKHSCRVKSLARADIFSDVALPVFEVMLFCSRPLLTNPRYDDPSQLVDTSGLSKQNAKHMPQLMRPDTKHRFFPMFNSQKAKVGRPELVLHSFNLLQPTISSKTRPECLRSSRSIARRKPGNVRLGEAGAVSVLWHVHKR